MEGVTAVVGLLSMALGAILGMLALGRKIETALEGKIRDVLDDSGLTKKGTKQDVWPNGSDNLPDSLQTIWKSIEANSAELSEIRKQR